MGFIVILLLTTLSIAGSAAFFSIYGLAQIFAGSFWPVVVMASSLEAGKLVSASYVYRYWKDISFLMKTYLLSAIFVLMLITSAGIFGFLSAAYQTDTLSLKEIESQIVLLDSEKKELRQRKSEIDTDVGRVGANYITKRMELIDKYSSETNFINTRIPAITAEIHKLKSAQIIEESHVGPIIYIAKVFDRSTDDATKWMILFLIFAFDPLAVALTIATNNVMMKRAREKAPVVKPVIIQTIPEEVMPEDLDEPVILERVFVEEVIIPEEVIPEEVIVQEVIIPEEVIPEEVVPEETFQFTEEDIIEPLDDLELHMELDLNEPENLITEINRVMYNPNVKDTQRILQFLIKKRSDEGITLFEQEKLDSTIKNLRKSIVTRTNENIEI